MDLLHQGRELPVPASGELQVGAPMLAPNSSRRLVPPGSVKVRHFFDLKLWTVRSPLHRSRSLRSYTSWKALDEIELIFLFFFAQEPCHQLSKVRKMFFRTFRQ